MSEGLAYQIWTGRGTCRATARGIARHERHTLPSHFSLQLREIQEATQRRDGADADDGPQKPLAEILREAKEKKEQAFQEGWREMKTGKNRPLTEDELQFFDTLAEAEALKRRRENEEEAAELDAFRRAREQEQARAGEPPSGRQDDGAMGPAVAPTAPLLSLQKEPSRPAVKRRKALAAVVRAAPKAPAASRTGQDPDNSDPAPTLGGLLGGYSSSSEDEA